MNIHSFFKECEQHFPELKDGIKRREVLADGLSQHDAPILDIPVEELHRLYLELFMNIATDEGLAKLSEQSTPETRYDSAVAWKAINAINEIL